MKSLWAMLVVGLLASGCGESAEDDVAETQGKATDNSTAPPKGTPPPVPTYEELEGTPAADQSAFGTRGSKPGNAVGKAVECTNRSGNSLSVTRFTVSMETGLITSLSVTMTNAVQSNVNSVSVSVRHPTEVAYTPGFSSDSNVLHGTTTDVPVPSGFKVPLGGSIKVDTSYGGGWYAPTTGECRIQL